MRKISGAFIWQDKLLSPASNTKRFKTSWKQQTMLNQLLYHCRVSVSLWLDMWPCHALKSYDNIITLIISCACDENDCENKFYEDEFYYEELLWRYRVKQQQIAAGRIDSRLQCWIWYTNCARYIRCRKLINMTKSADSANIPHYQSKI